MIFIPSGSFNLIIDVTEAISSLKKIYDYLEFGGVLLFEVITVSWKQGELNKWSANVWYHNNDKFIISNFLTLPDKDNIRHSIGKYELVESNKILKTEVEDFKVRMYDLKNLLTILKEVGFSEIKLHKTFDIDKSPDENDEVVIYECKK